MIKLNEKELRRVTNEVIESPGIQQWLAESRMDNLARMEEAATLDEVRVLQGENRVIKTILGKIPPDEV